MEIKVGDVVVLKSWVHPDPKLTVTEIEEGASGNYARCVYWNSAKAEFLTPKFSVDALVKK